MKNALMFLLVSLLLAFSLTACGGDGRQAGYNGNYGTDGLTGDTGAYNGSGADGYNGSTANGSGTAGYNGSAVNGNGSAAYGANGAGDSLMDDARNALDDAGNAVDRAVNRF